MKKVLIISPHFAPTNAPDMQRVRLALPYLRVNGWEPVVLAIDPSCIDGGVNDPLLEQTYPDDIRIVRVRGLAPKFTRWARLGSLWLRCGRAFRRAGETLLREEKFDLVFISTTQFDAFTLGPRWKRQFGVPYVLDYQDPWFNDYYARTGTRPPGGKLKFALAQRRARRHEPIALREAGAIVSVSAAYALNFARAYPWFDASRVRQLPFGAASRDLALARDHRPEKPCVPFDDGLIHHVYTGRCGADMTTSLTAVLRAFKLFKASHPLEASRFRLHFIGTGYAPPPLGREWVMPIARAEGVDGHVSEHCYRVPYFDALHALVKADALIAVGSDDPTYSASKIFPYVLAGRPLLAVFHNASPILGFLRQIGWGQPFSFETSADLDALASSIYQTWFVGGGMTQVRAVDPDAFLPFTAESMTRRLAESFTAALTTR